MRWMTVLNITSEENGIVTVRASGKLTRGDYEQFVPRMEQIMRSRGPVRMLIELVDFEGWEPAGLWEDLKFDIQHQDDLGRVAIVGEDTMQKWGTRLSAPFFRADMRYFPRSELARAREWLTAEPHAGADRGPGVT